EEQREAIGREREREREREIYLTHRSHSIALLCIGISRRLQEEHRNIRPRVVCVARRQRLFPRGDETLGGWKGPPLCLGSHLKLSSLRTLRFVSLALLLCAYLVRQ